MIIIVSLTLVKVAHDELELQVSHSICAEISKNGILQRVQGINRENTERTM